MHRGFARGCDFPRGGRVARGALHEEAASLCTTGTARRRCTAALHGGFARGRRVARRHCTAGRCTGGHPMGRCTRTLHEGRCFAQHWGAALRHFARGPFARGHFEQGPLHEDVLHTDLLQDDFARGLCTRTFSTGTLHEDALHMDHFHRDFARGHLALRPFAG